MTVTNTQTSTGAMQGNGATVVWPYAFEIPDLASALVTLVDTTVSPATTTTLGTGQFGITGLGAAAGGNVTYPLVGTPLIAGQFITVARNTALTQPTPIGNQGPYLPTNVEAMVDRVVLELQQLATLIGNCLQVGIGDPSGPPALLPVKSIRANQGAAFDANGNLIAGVLSTVPVNAAMVAVFQAASLAIGRAALGVGYGAGLEDDGTHQTERVAGTVRAIAAAGATITAADHLRVINLDTTAGGFNQPLPAANTMWNGFRVRFRKKAGAVGVGAVLQRAGADTIEFLNNALGTATQVGLQTIGDELELVCDGVSSWVTSSINIKVAAAVDLNGANQGSIIAAGDTKVRFTTKRYDTHNQFDGVTNFRFTAAIPGLYHISAAAILTAAGNQTGQQLRVYKNGSFAFAGPELWVVNGTNPVGTTVSVDVDMAVGDYVEIFYSNGDSSGQSLSGSTAQTYAHFARVG